MTAATVLPMADLQAIEARIWAILDPYRDRLEPATIYGIPSLRWPGGKAHDYFAAVKTGKAPSASTCSSPTPSPGRSKARQRSC